MKKLLLVAAATATLAISGAASAATFPGYGNDTGGPALLITLTSGGATIAATGQPATYDGSDDTYIGVINNSGQTVNSLHLSANNIIFWFEGDGINAYGAPGNAIDHSGYGGPQAYFTNISSDYHTGDVNFIGGIADGGSAYFSLEEALDAASFSSANGGGISVGGGVPEPAGWAMMMVGIGSIGMALRTRARKIRAALTA
jgi:hypothetical protein